MKAETALPLVSAEIREGREVFLIAASSRRLFLGAGVRDAGLLTQVEAAVGKEVLKYRA